MNVQAEILSFLEAYNVGALTTILKDDTLHAAAMHYSHVADPLTIYFSTDKTSRKCEALLDGSSQKAAFVLGLSEEEWITLQIEGNIKILSDTDEIKSAQDIHYAKHPNAEKYKDDPSTVLLAFTPTWYRYTDFNTKPPSTIASVQ